MRTPHHFARVKSFNSLRRVHNETALQMREFPSLNADIERSLLALFYVSGIAPGDETGEFFWRFVMPINLAHTEVEESYWLADIGFYRQAIAALRTAFELTLLGMCYSYDSASMATFGRWLQGKKGVHVGDLVKPIRASIHFRRFSLSAALSADINRCYKSLCDYAHSHGSPHSTPFIDISVCDGILQQDRPSFGHSFSATALRKYADSLTSVAKLSVTLALVRFPMAMQSLPLWDKFSRKRFPAGLLDEYDREYVLAVLEPRTVKALQALSDNDPGVQWMVRQVRALPDMYSERWEREWNVEDNRLRFIEWFEECERRSLSGA